METSNELEQLKQRLKGTSVSNLAKDGNTMDASWKLYDAERMANERLRQQLAASQGREVLLRDALKGVPIGYHGRIAGKECVCGQCQSNRIIEETLSLPYDTIALEAMIAKAGEVMRKRCDKVLEDIREEYGDEEVSAAWVFRAIHNLAGVTLEDLK